MKTAKSLENDYNHVGYFVLYTWHGYWNVYNPYDSEETWDEEPNEPEFFINNRCVDNCKEPLEAFMLYVSEDNKTQYHKCMAQLWRVEKSCNKIKAYQLADYCAPNELTEEDVINDTLSYDKVNPYYSSL